MWRWIARLMKWGVIAGFVGGVAAIAAGIFLVRTAWRDIFEHPISIAEDARCLQYRAIFRSDNGDRFPVLDRVTVRLND